MKSYKLFIIILIFGLAIILIWQRSENRKLLKSFEVETSKIKKQFEELKTIKLLRQVDLPLRISAETIFNADSVLKQLALIKKITGKEKIFFLYIPSTVCNDCMLNMYDILWKYTEKSVIVLTPIESLRENNTFFSQYNIPTSIVQFCDNMVIDQVLAFTYKDSPINFFVLNRNDTNAFKNYIESVNEL